MSFHGYPKAKYRNWKLSSIVSFKVKDAVQVEANRQKEPTMNKHQPCDQQIFLSVAEYHSSLEGVQELE